MVGKAIDAAEEKRFDITVTDTATNPREWDNYVEKHAGGHYAQTSYWAAVKETIGWKAVRLVIKDRGDIVGGAQLLLHSIQPWGNICYAIKAPLYPPDDFNCGRTLLTLILKSAMNQHCVLIVFQPPSSGTGFSQLLEQSGSRPSRLHPEHASTLVLDLSSGMEKIKSALKRQTYQSIRKSEREGIRVREGTNGDIPTFHRMHLATSDRQKFAPYPLGYFEAMWQNFQPQGHLALLLAEYEE